MNTREIVVIGVAVAIAVALSGGLAYGVMRQQSFQYGGYPGGVGSGYGYLGGVMDGLGYGAGMMGRAPLYSGGMMGGYFGNQGYPGGMMASHGWMMSNGGMMGSYYSQYPGANGGYAWNGQRGGAFVAIANYRFYPGPLTVAKGTTVTWVNMDFVQHTVTSGTEQSPTGLFDSHELNHMQGFSYTFNTPGTYTYYCDVHPDMVGTIIVTG